MVKKVKLLKKIDQHEVQTEKGQALPGKVRLQTADSLGMETLVPNTTEAQVLGVFHTGNKIRRVVNTWACL